MPQPMIRHLAIFARDPAKLARFYQEVLGMRLLHSDPKDKAFFVTDGHVTMALLPHRLEGSAPVGINHFGFGVEDAKAVSEKCRAFGVEEPKRRPGDRPYAEFRGVDPEGNWFDISEHGYNEVETQDDRDRKAAKV